MQAKTVRMRADAKQLVDGKLYLSGDFFMATPQDAEDLVAVRFATIVSLPEPLVTTALQPVDEETPLVAPKGVGRGRYVRRDLRSES